MLPLLLLRAVQLMDAVAVAHYLGQIDALRRTSPRPGTGADVGPGDAADQQCPLHAASAAGAKCIDKLLLAAGASVHLRNMNGLSPFFLALRSGHDVFVRLLLDTGASLKRDEETLLAAIAAALT